MDGCCCTRLVCRGVVAFVTIEALLLGKRNRICYVVSFEEVRDVYAGCSGSAMRVRYMMDRT